MVPRAFVCACVGPCDYVYYACAPKRASTRAGTRPPACDPTRPTQARCCNQRRRFIPCQRDAAAFLGLDASPTQDRFSEGPWPFEFEQRRQRRHNTSRCTQQLIKTTMPALLSLASLALSLLGGALPSPPEYGKFLLPPISLWIREPILVVRDLLLILIEDGRPHERLHQELPHTAAMRVAGRRGAKDFDRRFRQERVFRQGRIRTSSHGFHFVE